MKAIYSLPIMALMLTGCLMAARPGGGVEVIPFLPAVVEVDAESHYEYSGYHYFYNNDRWYYANSRGGARRELPRSQWPKETRRRGENSNRRNR